MLIYHFKDLTVFRDAESQLFKILYTSVNQVMQEYLLDKNNTQAEAPSSAKLVKYQSKIQEVDSILSDPSIRDSLRSDGYYNRNK